MSSSDIVIDILNLLSGKAIELLGGPSRCDIADDDDLSPFSLTLDQDIDSDPEKVETHKTQAAWVS